MPESGDLLMKIEGDQAVRGPGGSDVLLRTDGDGKTLVRNPLLKGFEPGYIIEIDSFSFQCGTSGLEPGAKPPTIATTHEFPTNERDKDDDTPSVRQMARRGGYQAWRSGTAVKYPLDVQPISFTRPIDFVSPLLIQSCIDSKSWESLTIVKRKPSGGKSAGEVYLRMDFTGVLIIKVDWSDDDVVKETCRFIARGITVSYRPQLAHGRLGPITQGFWSMVPSMTPEQFK